MLTPVSWFSRDVRVKNPEEGHVLGYWRSVAAQQGRLLESSGVALYVNINPHYERMKTQQWLIFIKLKTGAFSFPFSGNRSLQMLHTRPLKMKNLPRHNTTIYSVTRWNSVDRRRRQVRRRRPSPSSSGSERDEDSFFLLHSPSHWAHTADSIIRRV